MEVCKLESYSTKTVTIICIKHNFQQYCFHCKLVPIKLHIVTASGISLIITTCLIILSLFNPVLIFKIAFTNSALILLFNFTFTMFIWPNTRFITELSVVLATSCVEQNTPVFRVGFLRWHLHTCILQSNMLLCQ